MGVYKYTLDKTFILQTDIMGRNFVSDWIILDDFGVITIKRGYSWDGCSPKIEVLDLIIGTPDGRTSRSTNKALTYYASLLHDAIYQYKTAIPISRKEADTLFLTSLRLSGFFWSNLYYRVVRLFGGTYGNWKIK